MAKHRGEGTGRSGQGDGKRGETTSHKHVQQSPHSRDARKASSLVKRIEAVVEAARRRDAKKKFGK